MKSQSNMETGYINEGEYWPFGLFLGSNLNKKKRTDSPQFFLDFS